MLGSVCAKNPETKPRVINDVIECADKVAKITGKLVVKADSVFAAELAFAKTDQVPMLMP